MSLNLARPADFALATGSAVGTVANLFGKKPNDWELQEGSFNDVPFHVLVSTVSWGGALSTIRDSGGRRISALMFPYKDGQTTDDLGRSPESFDCDIVLYGDTYTAALRILMSQLQSPVPGTLVHPVRGVIKCKMDKYELIHSHDMRKAVALKVTFIEHSFSLASYGKTGNIKDFHSALSSLLQVFNAINSAINKVKAALNIVNTIKNEITTLYESYNGAFTSTIGSLNTLFNKTSSLEFPSLLPVNKGGIFKSDGTLVSTSWPTALNPNDPFTNVPLGQIQAQVAANQALFDSQLYSAQDATLDGLTGADGQDIGLQVYASVATAVQSLITQNKINSVRALADELIKTLKAVKFNALNHEQLGTDSDGSLYFYNEIMDLKRSVILLQNAYDAGLAQEQIGIKTYKTPRAMSIREVAYANGISPDRSYEIDLLNPELDSVNEIPKGTEVYVTL